MTLKQLQILGAQVDIVRALIWQQEQYSESSPFCGLAPVGSTLYRTALNRLLGKELVMRRPMHNLWGEGYRVGYSVSDAGKEWYKTARDEYSKLLHQSSSK